MIMVNKRPRLLLVSSDTPGKSSFVARLAWLRDHSDFKFEVTEELGWPSVPSASQRESSFRELLRAKAEADLVILHRVLFDYRFRKAFFSDSKPVIFDFDDAIYSVPSGTYRHELKTIQGWYTRAWRLVARGRVDYAGRFRPLVGMLKRVDGVSAGNPHLAHFASKYCAEVATVPTVVDAHRFVLKTHREQVVTIGWYGSPDNHWYLDNISEVCSRLHKAFGNRVRFSVISSQKYRHAEVPWHWIPWRRESELEDILNFDVGIMPLTDDEWARGKSGNKALYYMAAGIPPVVSPVGVNSEIVQHGQTGFLAKSQDEWFNALSTLIVSPETRTTLGLNARNRVLTEYSREVAAAQLSQLVLTILSKPLLLKSDAMKQAASTSG